MNGQPTFIGVSEELKKASMALGRLQGAEEERDRMRWPYRAQGALIGAVFVAVCLVPFVRIG